MGDGGGAMGRGELEHIASRPARESCQDVGRAPLGQGRGWWGPASHRLRDGIFPQGEAHVSGNGRANRV